MDQDLQPLLEVRQNQLSVILNENTSIDTKALAILSINLAILIFAGQDSIHLLHWYQGALLIVSYVLSIVINIALILPWPYPGVSVNLDEHPEYLQLDSTDLLLQLISDTEQAIGRGQRLNLLRWVCVLVSLVLTTIGTITLFAII
jgi:hypothetical protein